MNRKIFTSLGVMVFVAAVAITATGAFFSDSETSTGNTFTAGALDLKVDSVQHYNGMVCVEDNESRVWAPEANVTLDENMQPVLGAHDFDAYNTANPFGYPRAGAPCDGTWALTDLGNGVHKFWNFDDVKPGDEGENTISLHVDNNPAWACIDVSLTKNDDMTCTEPELGDDATCVPTPGDVNLFDGELAQNLKFAAWADDGDNIWEQGEPLLFSNQSGPASDVLGGKTYALADSVTGPGPLPGGSTSYIGLQWCAGNQTVDLGNNTITCDGAGMNNAAQTDSMTADVTFRVEQHRNNENFLCEPREEEVVTRLTLAKAVLPPEVALDTAFTLTADGPTDISGVEGNASITNAIVAPGVYALSETGGPEQLPTSRTWECSGNATAEINNGDGTGSVTIAAGETVVCGITNNYNPAL